MKDNIKAPAYYTYGNIECKDYILDKQFDFCLGNAIKYITRAGRKHSQGLSDVDKKIQDLQKAIQYLKFEINYIEETTAKEDITTNKVKAMNSLFSAYNLQNSIKTKDD